MTIRSRRLVGGFIAVAAALTLAVSAFAASGAFTASLSPIPHDPDADGGSNVTGSATLDLRGTNLTGHRSGRRTYR